MRISQFTTRVPGAVVVNNDCFLDVGLESDIVENYQAAEVMDCGGKVLLPGLINAHTHVPMTLLRGLADDLRLDLARIRPHRDETCLR